MCVSILRNQCIKWRKMCTICVSEVALPWLMRILWSFFRGALQLPSQMKLLPTRSFDKKRAVELRAMCLSSRLSGLVVTHLARAMYQNKRQREWWWWWDDVSGWIDRNYRQNMKKRSYVKESCSWWAFYKFNLKKKVCWWKWRIFCNENLCKRWFWCSEKIWW